MTEIWAGIIFYDDKVELLQATFDSVKRAGCKIVAVDGAYAEFPLEKHEKPWSTDGCLDLARKEADVVIEASKCWSNQMEKRTQYIKAIPPGEYCFYIDSDEVLEGGLIDKNNLERDRYSLSFYETLESGKVRETTSKHFRFFKVYEDMEYKHRHFLLYRTSRIKEPTDPSSGFQTRDLFPQFLKSVDGKGMSIAHYPWKRGEPRLCQDGKYLLERAENKCMINPPETFKPSGFQKFHIQSELEYENLKQKPGLTKDDLYYNEIVFVEYLSMTPYSNSFVSNAIKGTRFKVPRWEFLRMVCDYSSLAFKEVEQCQQI